MTAHLLDVNLLIAIADPAHVHHEKALTWFAANQANGWATCPIVENCFIRILSNPAYKPGPVDSQTCRELLVKLCSLPGYQFWPDSISLKDQAEHPDLPGSKHLTDYYLLSLAIHNKARFATLDTRIDAGILPGGERTLVKVST